MNTETCGNAFDPIRLIKGLFPLPKFIRLVREKSAPGSFDEAALMTEWREARAVALRIIEEEAGSADNIEVSDLPADMLPLAAQVLQRPSMHRLNCLVPRSWRMVEIDRLVVFQDAINLRHVDQLRASLSPDPSAQDLIDFASHSGSRSPPAVRFSQSDGSYTFSSESNDLRFLDVVTLAPTAIQDYQPFGSASHALVIYLGFSDNVISAVRFDKRIVLINGSHRVYALRELGFRQVPCLLTDASDRDGSDFLLPAEVKQDRHFYLHAPRPPLFKDYADPRLTRMVPVARKTHVLQAKLDLQKTTVPVP